ncbi:MAG: ExbD/TolR family protein [Bdellovibrionales bacterium]
MGMGGPKKFGRASMSEINVTPLVDVMLVLLIIFMVTAPMTKTGITVALPKTQKTNSIESAKPLDVVINRKNEIFIGKKKVSLKNFDKHISPKNKSARLEADERASYGTVAQVLSKIKNKGISDISLVTEEVQ